MAEMNDERKKRRAFRGAALLGGSVARA